MTRAGFGAESEASQATGRVHEENLLNLVMKDKWPKTFAGNQICSGTPAKDGSREDREPQRRGARHCVAQEEGGASCPRAGSS